MGGGKSSSSSATATTSSQTTGGSGEFSPALTAGGDVSIETGGEEVSLAALAGMAETVQTALEQAGTFAITIAGNQADATAAQAVNDTSLLSSVLEANSELAANVQSGGAASAQKTTNYVVFGLIGIAVLAVGVFLSRK
jgi:hypothetical protein